MKTTGFSETLRTMCQIIQRPTTEDCNCPRGCFQFPVLGRHSTCTSDPLCAWDVWSSAPSM